MTLTAARQVADAVLYEGYLLYPYRASSAKNKVRWQFGVLGPEGASAAGVGEEPALSAEMLVGSEPGGTVDVLLRFLHVQLRTVERWTERGWFPVDELVVGGTRWIPFHEAVPYEVLMPGLPLAAPAHGRTIDVSVPGATGIEELYDGEVLVGRLVRTRWELAGTVEVSTRPGLDPRVTILTVRVRNGSSWPAAPSAGWAERDVAARYSLVGTHLLLTATGSDFISLLDGPGWSAADAASCAQSRCWPVLVDDDDGRDAVLVSPIILGDHPAIAPESAGDLFDATEIDEILTLRVMTMTDREKSEARGTDPRAAAILERCDAMSDEGLQRLHGGRREVVEDELPWWDAGADARAQPTSDSVLVNGVPVAAGSRVLLRPSRRADAQDLFLAGLTAVVTRVYFDVDGGTHLAVALEDDPGSDLYATTGRFYYFGPEEVEPLPARQPKAEAP
ncbi:MAG: hypothetical protein QOD91_653 [Frankiales bacterium]|nr:hypothetical protein [Frankiales bacterium]